MTKLNDKLPFEMAKSPSEMTLEMDIKHAKMIKAKNNDMPLTVSKENLLLLDQDREKMKRELSETGQNKLMPVPERENSGDLELDAKSTAAGTSTKSPSASP